MLHKLDRPPLGPAEQLLEPPLALDQRQVAQVLAVMLDQVEGEQHRLMAPSWLRSAWKSGVPSPRALTASPSIRNDGGRFEVCLLRHRRPMEMHDFPIRAAFGDNECNTSRIAKGLAIQHAG